jgi:hypothetical protein
LIIHLKGGLGNQLFQLSFAHLIFEQSKRQQYVFLPRSYRNSSDIRTFLSQCNHVKHVSTLSSFSLEMIFRFRWLQDVLIRLGVLCLEKDYSNERLLNRGHEESISNRFRFFSGFWQDWKYAFTSEQVFADELEYFLDSHVDTPLGLVIKDHIAVHIRRGDFLEKHNREVYGIVPLRSYEKVLQACKRDYPNYSVITVSDSPSQVRAEGANANFGTVLGPELCDPWQVLKIMRGANVVISANSTLSWWGAFIAARQGTSVFVPTPWYANYSIEASERKKFPKFQYYDAEYSLEC